MSNQLDISSERMLLLIEWAVTKGMAERQSSFLEMIDFPRNNIGNIKAGTQGFTRKHIENACRLTGANANWIFGFEANMLRKEIKKSPVEKIEDALVELKASFGKNSSKKGS